MTFLVRAANMDIVSSVIMLDVYYIITELTISMFAALTRNVMLTYSDKTRIE
jgi:hypothetical protein